MSISVLPGCLISSPVNRPAAETAGSREIIALYQLPRSKAPIIDSESLGALCG